MQQILKTMCIIRCFEKKLDECFAKGLLRGTMHGAVGQELSAAILMRNIKKEEDYVFATHRCHGYFLAYSEDPFLLAGEMMGKKSGPVMGAGGSQHIRYRNFFTNGITGGMAPIAVGVALRQKRKGRGITVSVLGDGGFNEGYVQEAFNLAAIYSVPVLFVLENNRYAMSTPSAQYTAGTIKERVYSYGIEYHLLDTNDMEKFNKSIKSHIRTVRQKSVPVFLEIPTFRLCGHSKNDTCAYMDQEERQYHEKNDPLKLALEQQSPLKAQELMDYAQKIVDEAFRKAEIEEEIHLADFLRRQGDQRQCR
jgi:TPP-dependent pyruvate/acetoin dehydrogenase alpha subunit